MKLIYTLLVLLFPLSVFSQLSSELSETVDIPSEGWNKVIMMRNGNTMLFHFEMRKHITVKVFDKSRKEAVSFNCLTKILDLNLLNESTLRGVYDINGEAVVFIEQLVFNKNSLIRLRFDAVSGKMIDEIIVTQSSGLSNQTSYRVLREAKVDTYYTFCFKHNIILHPENVNELTKYNENHEPIGSYAIAVDTKKFRYVGLLGANIDEKGNVFIGLAAANDDVTSTRRMSVSDNSPATFFKEIDIWYKAKNSDKLLSRAIEIPSELHPSYSIGSYNSFAHKINLLILDSHPGLYKYGLQTNYIINRTPLFVTIDEADLTVQHKWLTYDNVNARLKEVDTAKHFSGVPVSVFTNENGLTTVVSEGYARYSELENNGFKYQHTYLGNIALTQLNDDGKELWGTAVPQNSVLDDFIFPDELVGRTINKSLFRRSSRQDVLGKGVRATIHAQKYQDQFASINCYSTAKNLYFVFNDNASHFSNSLAKPGDTVYKYEFTDAFYYRMDKKREIKKSYLFGPSAENESRSAFLESADFDEQTNTYSVLVFHRKGDDFTMQLAWCHLD